MSGELAARALEAQFESIRRSEFTRLRKKVSTLSPEHVAEVDAITAHVVHALVRCPAEALARDAVPSLIEKALELFHVPQPAVD
jgi:hypothetical protein